MQIALSSLFQFLPRVDRDMDNFHANIKTPINELGS